jgi:hypothetical protein
MLWLILDFIDLIVYILLYGEYIATSFKNFK